MAKYKIVNNEEGDMSGIIDNERACFIPKTESNRDYQEYLAWVAEGNEPDPASE